MSDHPALQAGRTAVITGAASGIGLAAATRFAGMGMHVVMADNNASALESESERLQSSADRGSVRILAIATDVSQADAVDRLKARAYEEFSDVAVLMNNAGIEQVGRALERAPEWQRILSINLWGVIHGTQAFAPAMIEQDRPSIIINTGSKQGITCPPGNAAYNVSKAGVKAYTEQVAHELRSIENCLVSAHLLIPGFTFTGFTKARVSEKPPGAWAPAEVIDFMLKSLASDDFYILCPDNEISRPMDERRIQWAAGDIVENRPALSRWHPDYASPFAEFAAMED